MDPVQQVFATGGVTGVVGVVLYMFYKFFSERHRIRSNCCGKVVDIETQGSQSTPTAQNINPMVEDGRKPDTHRKNQHSTPSESDAV